MESFGEKLYNLRKAKGISQKMFAEKANVSRQTVSKWENNTVNPSLENIDKICEILSVNRASLFNKQPDEKIKINDEVACVDLTRKKGVGLLVGLVVTSIILCFLIITTVFLGYIALFNISGDVVINTDNINIDLFYCFLVISIVVMILEILLIAVKIKKSKKK